MRKSFIFIIVLALLTAAGFEWYLRAVDMTAIKVPPTTSAPAPKSDQPEPTTNTPLPEPDSVTAPSDGADAPRAGFAKLADNAIYVPEQRPGKLIVIGNLNIVPEGYVVIREYKNGTPGAVLGVTALAAGTQTTKVRVSLDRAAQDGEELIAMLYADDGQAGFDVTKDTPVLDLTGSPLSMSFSVFADAQDPATSEVMF